MLTEKIITTILQQESVRVIIYGVVVFILYHIFFKKSIDNTVANIKNFSTEMDAIKKTLLTLLYAELKKMHAFAVKNGGKTYEEDEIFEELWKNYIALGDGHGDSLHKDWKTLKLMPEVKNG